MFWIDLLLCGLIYYLWRIETLSQLHKQCVLHFSCIWHRCGCTGSVFQSLKRSSSSLTAPAFNDFDQIWGCCWLRELIDFRHLYFVSKSGLSNWIRVNVNLKLRKNRYIKQINHINVSQWAGGSWSESAHVRGPQPGIAAAPNRVPIHQTSTMYQDMP